MSIEEKDQCIQVQTELLDKSLKLTQNLLAILGLVLIATGVILSYHNATLENKTSDEISHKLHAANHTTRQSLTIGLNKLKNITQKIQEIPDKTHIELTKILRDQLNTYPIFSDQYFQLILPKDLNLSETKKKSLKPNNVFSKISLNDLNQLFTGEKKHHTTTNADIINKQNLVIAAPIIFNKKTVMVLVVETTLEKLLNIEDSRSALRRNQTVNNQMMRHQIIMNQKQFLDTTNNNTFEVKHWDDNLGIGVITHVTRQTALSSVYAFQKISYTLYFIFVILTMLAITLIYTARKHINNIVNLLNNSNSDPINSTIDELQSMQSSLLETEQKNQAKTNFILNLSHELRTPLNAIVGFSQILQLDNSINSAQKESINEILNAANHLQSLIEETMDLSQIESEHINLNPTLVDITEIFNNAISLLSIKAAQKNITLIKEYDEDQAVSLKVDKKRFTQIVLNLLSNAIKYNKPDGTVKLSYEKSTHTIEIKVTDSGIGISEENINELFKPFQRFHNSTHQTEGVGLGLVITKKLVQAHNGDIYVTSKKGEGSVFHLKLPI